MLHILSVGKSLFRGAKHTGAIAVKVDWAMKTHLLRMLNTVLPVLNRLYLGKGCLDRVER